MKLNMYFILLALGTCGLQSCDNDDDSIQVSPQVQQALSSKYPGARFVEWESKSGYYVADFRDNTYETEAWFTPDGVWKMTETDIPYIALPQAVKNQFEISEYKSWRKEDIDKLEYSGTTEPIYIIEVEQGNQEVDLHYSQDGVLIKSVIDMDDDNQGYLPSPSLTATIELFIKNKYPNARIFEVEEERGMLEVDIIHDNRSKEVIFDKAGTWISTSWEVRQIPAEITNAVKNSPQYATYRIDDADYFETPQGDYYLLELELGNIDVKVKVDSTGKFI